jgi:transposase InsO family protein
VRHIRAVLEASPFVGEGYRKVWARLRHRGIRTSKDRCRRLMRENDLQGHHYPRRQRGNKAHDGRITTDQPTEMWGTDATAVLTRRHGNIWVFLAIDHCTSECVGLHAAIRGSRLEALEPIRQGVRQQFGGFDQGVADGLTLRHDHGSQYTSRHFQEELRFLGIRSSASFVAEPECNGVAERFVKTLKEQCLWLHTFDTVDDVNAALATFKETYNHGWLVAKHANRTPVEARQHLAARQAA